MLKIRGTEIQQALTELMMHGAGPQAQPFAAGVRRDPARIECRRPRPGVAVANDDERAARGVAAQRAAQRRAARGGGHAAAAVLAAGKQMGETDIVLKALDLPRWSGRVQLDNESARASGAMRLSGHAVLNSPRDCDVDRFVQNMTT